MIKSLLLVLTLSLSACVQLPKPLRGDYSTMPPQQYQQTPVTDLRIRWTGIVIDVENKPDHSCLTVMAKVPNEYGRPSYQNRVDLGRFIACKNKFLEPKYFQDRAITVTGQVKRLVVKKIDQLDYNYPLVDANVIYVW
ncbi:Slp family lipoprotein [Marinicella gelatinilytica]|uniref:Slp family lipoprotein n=1 Tax=Marinicella gelatinilytica TaxID=2996017 RepID=UPI002260BD61|nr:Slp family lipoprotein [Marinicella gelatinilytica]MCX7545477.1 Slp family lipoprotein [Marinicella gelatinilytica]